MDRSGQIRPSDVQIFTGRQVSADRFSILVVSDID